MTLTRRTRAMVGGFLLAERFRSAAALAICHPPIQIAAPIDDKAGAEPDEGRTTTGDGMFLEESGRAADVLGGFTAAKMLMFHG